MSTGAYGYVRHPIYTALMLAWVALLLRAYSPATALILSVQCALLVIKSLVEEGFLRHDPEYAAYMLQVRHRFIPGIV